jgi:hypothetical protein
MSRIRSVHPGFFRDERLVQCSAFARLLFIGLGVEADDKGIFEWKPLTLKMTVFPGDNVDVPALLDELEKADAIMRFEANGRDYGAIRNFRKFQKPKTPNDIHPMPDYVADYVSFPPKGEIEAPEPPAVPPKAEKSAQMEDGGGKREGEKKKPSASPRGTRWQKGQKVPDEWKAWARSNFPSVEPYRFSTEVRKFEDYWPAQPGRAGIKIDWELTWRNWLRNAFPGQETEGTGPPAEDLVVLRPDDEDFKAVQRIRGSPIIVGKNGTATFTKAEVAKARAA